MAELGVLEAFEQYRPLGPDFLTWLAMSARAENAVTLADGTRLELEVRGPLALAAGGGEATKVTLAGDDAVGAPELRSALGEGKRLVKARLVLTEGADQYAFTFNAETFDLSALKVPVPRIPDLAQYATDRVTAMQHLFDVVERAYEEFLALRLAPEQWAETVESWTAE
ncbi:MAG: hypothetical protein SF028_01550 [Candidatus Sumerlaeia bacterium]|nr:hypothetical protein [Candidatus Sumerlaeia bacterium]